MVPAAPDVPDNVWAPLALGTVATVIGADPLGPVKVMDAGTAMLSVLPPSPVIRNFALVGAGLGQAVAPEPAPEMLMLC